VKLIAQLKLLPTPEQADALRRTLETTNAACNFISQIAWDAQTFGKFAVQKLCYAAVREQFGLAAQMTIRALAKVADAYKLDTKRMRSFRPHGAISYDDRILSFNRPKTEASIWTLDGRQALPFVCGERQRALLQTQHGEIDLVLVNGAWYLFAVCDVEEPTPIDVEGVLGIDLGTTNIATDSDGTIHSGRTVKSVRYRHRRLRNRLQKKGTLAAKRRLRKLAGQEYRFAKDVNHTISKRIVREAQRTKRAIALEDLTGIRMRVRARKSQRTVLHSWSFAQLQAYIAYKARQVGVPVVLVNPRNTSRMCPACGHIAKANRATQAAFKCLQCGCAGHADTIAAGNIRVLGRAAVMQPYISEADQPSCQRQAAGL